MNLCQPVIQQPEHGSHSHQANAIPDQREKSPVWVESRFGEEYQEYKQMTPRFLGSKLEQAG